MLEPFVSDSLEDEFSTPERVHIRETWNRDQDPDCSIALARVEPGVTTAWHYLDGVVERYRLIAGVGLVEVGALPPTPVKAGDLVVIPAGVRQRIHNTGSEDLIFDCICTPRFTPECYNSLDISASSDS
jgi:mannose-6-phosphate isomerase-like protein (cupin superfamily)